MSKKVNRRAIKPGELLHIGERKLQNVQMQLFDYDQDSCSEVNPLDLNENFTKYVKNSTGVKWFNIYGLHDIKVIEKIKKEFDLDNMVLEDLLNTTHRPKIEEYNDYFFFTLKVLGKTEEGLGLEQMSFVVGENFLISFQEKEGDFFDHIRKRIRGDLGPIRTKQADFLFYLMIDSLIDTYYQLNEIYEEVLEDLNDEINVNPYKNTAYKIEKAKKDVLLIKKSLWPLKEAVLKINKGMKFIGNDNLKYFSDLKDSVLEISEAFETRWQLLEGAFNLYHTLVNSKANDIMKLLTIIATIFIPLTFIAGIYGMNFKFMPELEWKYSYPILWGVLISIFIGMIIIFKRKKWL